MPTSPTPEKIEARAYEIWEEEGRPHGQHDQHWARALTELTGGSKPRAKTATGKANGKSANAAGVQAAADLASPPLKTSSRKATTRDGAAAAAASEPPAAKGAGKTTSGRGKGVSTKSGSGKSKL